LSRPRLALIIPAYNEADRILPTLERLESYMNQLPYSAVVVVVSDGSRDATQRIVSQFSSERPQFNLIHYSQNRGKGYAVRTGMLQVEADFLLLSDADLATPIEEVEKLWQAIDSGSEVAIGSRPLKESRLEVRQPWYRELLGRVFNLLVQTLAIRGIADTQCGFKLFTDKSAKDIFSRCKLDGFGFDFEALMIAKDLGYQIAEVPVRWSHQEGSKVVLLRDGPRMIRDLVRLRLAGKRRRLQPNSER
jgi:dolichyl-phosphate beta-glucosyltransferase